MNPIILIPIAAIFVVGMIVGRNELVKRKLACPRKGTSANVDVVRRFLKPDRLVRIKRCSLLADPRKIDCDEVCLHSNQSGST